MAEERERLFLEFGTSGISRWGIQEEFLVELQGIQGLRLYQEMRWNDPIINAVFFGIEHSLRQVRYYAEPASDRPEDRQAAEFLEQCIHDMSFTWDDTLQFILTMLEQGVSVLEIVYKKRLGPNPPPYVPDPAPSQFNDGRIGWRKWAPRPLDTLAPGEEWVFDEKGGVQGIRQQAPPDYVTRTIPIRKLLLFRTTPAPHNNPMGRSILRGMYASYFFASQLREIEAIGIERNLVGVPIAYLGRDCTFSGETSDYVQIQKALRRLRRDEQEVLVLPRHKMAEGGETGIRVELLSPARGTVGKLDISPVISRYEKRIALTVLAQFVMLGMEGTGSYALARTQKDFFSMAIGAWANQIASVINRYAVPRLFALNAFPGITGLPRWIPSEAGVPDLQALATYVNKLVGAGVIQPDEALESAIRAYGRLPQRRRRPAEEAQAQARKEAPGESEESEDLAEILALLEELAGLQEREA